MTKFIIIAKPDSSFLLKEAQQFLGLKNLEAVKQYDIYETDQGVVSEELLKLFPGGELVDTLDQFSEADSFRYRQILGQYDEKQEMIQQMITNMRGLADIVHHSTIISLPGLSSAEVESFIAYFINETETERVPFQPLSYDMGVSSAKDLQVVSGFIQMTESELQELIQDYSMDMSDIQVVQEYFQAEQTDPTIFQLKVIDTYWSDHCRHTTFMTELTNMRVADGNYQEVIQATIAEYNQVRANLQRTKPITLMDLATINAKDARKLGFLDNLDESDEVNACCIRIKVDVDGNDEDYLLYFKNETHNHPTEIEPFGGAATCIGGGIRDPLSGRSYVHQAMRISGAKSPLISYEETRAGKLPQRVISQRAAQGYSDYGNQIGQTSGYLREYYHDGFEAKRMELGALVAAAPIDHVIRMEPAAGDAIILLGGRTGRDGLGAAVGSSMVQTKDSIELQGAEVQKGNPSIERKIIRLFRKSEATRLIKRCNDFGAGGVSVAIGELADGLLIDLDQVPTKYPGMDPCEIALSESQERMAVVVAAEDVEQFINLATEEDLEANVVAQVTDSPYMIMRYAGEEVLRLKRDFINSNGGAKYASPLIESETIAPYFSDERDIKAQLTDLNQASQKALGQNFDFTIGKNTVLAPFGGKNRMTTQEGMASKIPVLAGDTQTVSLMTVAYKPNLASLSPYHGAYYAVIDSVAKLVALGVPYQEARLTFQEFFERLTDEVKWGKPTGALLGAFKAMKQLDLAAIGGKDSMSGSFEELTVPPSLISFAVATTKLSQVNSRELKRPDSKILFYTLPMVAGDILDPAALRALFAEINNLISKGKVRAISTLNDHTIEGNLVEMALGNNIGFTMDTAYLNQRYPLGFLVEVAKGESNTGSGIEVAYTHEEAVAGLEQSYSLTDLAEAYTSVFADVFSQVEIQEVSEVAEPLTELKVKSDAKVLIPVMTGVNGEYDLFESFKCYTPNVDFFVIKQELDYANSLAELATLIPEYDILAFPDGSILGNQLEYGQALALVIEDLQETLESFIQDKYILAIGAAFAAFVRTGFMEFGNFQAGTQLDFLANPYEKFISEIVEVNVVKESPFSRKGSYSTAIASYHSRLVIDESRYAEQILAKYANFFDAEHTVDAMTDPSGHILGVNGNFERFNMDGMANVAVNEANYIANLIQMTN